ncbi:MULTISPECIES: zinc-dependent alcohol dehydrogenase family protein [unclassified Mesorhizobium]|uniref:zinc-dependent alcohol dehydrogenase family protein n=2 Tax=Mesorhizobium TaxID=68287 RepID=UPI000FCBC132|nr:MULTISPECIES: zinc-dependent alcohol dehydrogenase family protein [unclassified Mesorhizobium]RUX70937.1 alcohol dehydrogenase [Mesorhizobium sp. M7A.F.Ca.US.005.03.1.1]RUY15113.1 alcohol dehydrogenase [Mesorhizobium sp. M7A.F.Ca.US.005.03.2.1]RUY23080.1 alcohol dehydrogenase [Mesorhizobium sp. M7A.F.Ca.US.001.04.2.1]RUY35129.1 alcohol dehydrogenase [Mesorhizobium sp. M7A.F.Ca.US.001.04.1.1]RUZ98469.1 alcohol dehydrogenase [Mesorhizobium sp. M7A.F.Ca.US.001.02.1.1]
MKAVVFEKFGEAPRIQTVPDPKPAADGVVIKVEATGLCRSDWHGWMGHDEGITLPHVPGHELAGIVVAAGKQVTRWKAGERVTVPFAVGCGRCFECNSGNHQVCEHQTQPGFTGWGSFAEYVAIEHADTNLVRLPDEMEFATAASLGCRFVTSFRAIVDQGRVKPGEWVAVHGCGGVGLSAIMIASAMGANVIAIDLTDEKLDFAKKIGAVATINASTTPNVVKAVKQITNGGAHMSMDALGHPTTSFNSIANLRRRGRHVQVGLMLGEHARPQVPMDKVIAFELEILGSHGMQAYRYPAMMEMIRHGKLKPELLVGKRISLDEAPAALMAMGGFEGIGIGVVTKF